MVDRAPCRAYRSNNNNNNRGCFILILPSRDEEIFGGCVTEEDADVSEEVKVGRGKNGNQKEART